jgi:tetratricopeptide (TPR) repeat protein
MGPNPSGWTEERSQCWEYLVETYRSLGEIDNAIKCAHNAMIEDERFPTIYINLAMCYLFKQNWERAMFWVRLATKLDAPKTTLVSSPKDMQTRTLEILFHCALNTSKVDEAMAAAEKLAELLPESQEMQNRLVLARRLKNNSELTKMVVGLAKYLEQSGEGSKVRSLLDAAPELIRDNPFMIDWGNKVNPPKTWSDKEICIYVGPCFTMWSPKNLSNPGQSFVGGSEEAVVYLSKALNDAGWKVTVYADPGVEEGEHDGVMYLPYYKWNKRDDFNIVIAWRRPDFVDQEYKSKKTYVWCHDIQSGTDYTEERLKKIYKVIVLSPWHRKNIPNVPDEKIMISSNGVNI